MIGFERNGAFRLGLSEPLDAFKANDPHVKCVAPGQLINHQFQRINVLPVMLNQMEHGFHFFVLLNFHGFIFAGTAF